MNWYQLASSKLKTAYSIFYGILIYTESILKEIKLFFNQNNYFNEIANNTYVKMDKLPAEKKALLKQQNCDGIIVKHLDMLMTSWQLNMILVNKKEPDVITIFQVFMRLPSPIPDYSKIQNWSRVNFYGNNTILLIEYK